MLSLEFTELAARIEELSDTVSKTARVMLDEATQAEQRMEALARSLVVLVDTLSEHDALLPARYTQALRREMACWTATPEGISFEYAQSVLEGLAKEIDRRESI